MSTFNIRGNKEVAAVVPTPSRPGAYAKNVANMFKDFNLFFIESSGKYFNYSKSLNFGVKIALETDPKMGHNQPGFRNANWGGQNPSLARIRALTRLFLGSVGWRGSLSASCGPLGRRPLRRPRE